MEIDECANEQVGRFRRHPAAAAAAALSGNAQASGPHNGTQNAIIKSLLNKLRLSGSKLKSEKFSFSIPGSASSDTPLNQVKQSDQLDRNGRISAGVSPFEQVRTLQPSQRPSPTVHAVHFDGSGSTGGADAPPLISSSAGPSPQSLLPAQRSVEGGLGSQPSWGSPRSDPTRTSEAGALEAFRTFSLGGLGLGSGNSGSSSGGGGGPAQGKFVRPSNVPPLNLSRLANRDDPAAKQRSSSGRQSGLPSPTPGAPSSSGAHGPGGPQPLTPHQLQQQLLESLADLEEELTAWAAPPRWNPSSQGRWYLYPPIGRKDVNPVEQLLETLAPSQASAVVLLWRQYAAARYSAELMAGRAVRLCRELGHELAECRAEVEERTQRHSDHAAQLGKAIVRLQQQLDEARRAAAAATSAAAAATAAAAEQQSAEACQQQTPDGGSGIRSSQTGLSPVQAAQGSSPAKRQSSRAGSGAGALFQGPQHASGRAGGGSALPEREKRPTGRSAADSAAAAAAAAAVAVAVAMGTPKAATAENEELAAQLEQMRQLFLEAHEDSRALRDALMEVDEQNMQLYEQSNGLRRHAAAVLKENDALRQEVAQLRGLLTGSGGAGSLAAASNAVSTAVAAADSATAPPRRARPHQGSKSISAGGGGAGGGAGAGGAATSSETGMRASVHLPIGGRDHSSAGAAASTPPRPPLSNTGAAPAPAPCPTSAAAPVAAAPTSASFSGRKSDGGLTGATVRASVRRPVGAAVGMDGLSYGASRDPSAPPLPPARGSSARAKSTTRGTNALSSGRPTVTAANVTASGDHASIAVFNSLDGAVGKVPAGGGGGERAHRNKTLNEALSTEGAVVVVHAARRGGITSVSSGSGAAVYTPPSRSRSTELVQGQMNFVTDAALSKAAVGGAAAAVSSAAKGGITSSGSGSGSDGVVGGGAALPQAHAHAQVRGPPPSAAP